MRFSPTSSLSRLHQPCSQDTESLLNTGNRISVARSRFLSEKAHPGPQSVEEKSQGINQEGRWLLSKAQASLFLQAGCEGGGTEGQRRKVEKESEMRRIKKKAGQTGVRKEK